VLYKPVSYDRALSSFRAAQNLLYRDKRHKARAVVHTHATVDYAGGEQAKATLVDLAEDGMAVNFGKRLPPDLQSLFSISIARTNGERAALRPGGVAGLERARRDSLCGCAADFAAGSAGVVEDESGGRFEAAVGFERSEGRAFDSSR